MQQRGQLNNLMQTVQKQIDIKCNHLGCSRSITLLLKNFLEQFLRPWKSKSESGLHRRPGSNSAHLDDLSYLIRKSEQGYN